MGRSKQCITLFGGLGYCRFRVLKGSVELVYRSN